MTDRFTEQKRNKYIDNIESRMSTASSQMGSFTQSVQDIYSNWSGYQATSPDADELDASKSEFGTKARALVEQHKANLAQALDIIAAGIPDGEGGVLSRQDLLDEIAAVGS